MVLVTDARGHLTLTKVQLSDEIGAALLALPGEIGGDGRLSDAEVAGKFTHELN